MLKIIIVEDSETMQKKIKSIVRKALFSTEQSVEIYTYTRYDANLTKEVKDYFTRKIYLMDIELGDKTSGIDIAQYVRTNDWDSDIIFLTNHDKMFEKVYRTLYKVFDFIEKFDNLERRLIRDLNIILNREHDTSMFKYTNKKITIQVYNKEITYITRDKSTRKLIINTESNRFYLNMSIADILKRLDKRFAMVHRCCIVNKDRVQLYNWKEGYFLLNTGEKVFLLSKTYLKEIEDQNE